MATNYQQDGTTLNYTNGTGAAILSGAAVVIGGLLAVAIADIGTDETGAVLTEGVFVLPKGSEAIEAGQAVDFDVSEGAVDMIDAADSGDLTGCGVAWQSADAGDGTVAIKINASAAKVTA